MLRMFLIRFILPLVAFLVIRYLLKTVLRSYKATIQSGGEKDPGSRAGGELKRDPVCGTYVAANASVTRVVGSETRSEERRVGKECR